jgi:hypothetical protein
MAARLNEAMAFTEPERLRAGGGQGEFNLKGAKPLQCSLRRASAMGTPLVQLSHPARLRGAESGTA